MGIHGKMIRCPGEWLHSPRIALQRLVAVVSIASLAACSGPPHPEPTPSLGSWLTVERQDRLADAVSTGEWSAGCVFRSEVNTGVLAELPRPAGKLTVEYLNELPELKPAVRFTVEGAEASGSYREWLPDGEAFCYVPD